MALSKRDFLRLETPPECRLTPQLHHINQSIKSGVDILNFFALRNPELVLGQKVEELRTRGWAEMGGGSLLRDYKELEMGKVTSI